MATLPRYQQMGIQYADLPRISTAGVDVGAKSMDVLGQSLDRMIEFAYQRKVTEAEEKAKKYAIENPRTKQQIDDALATGQGTKIPGAGRIFQQTYDKVQAQLLSTELQLQANKAFSAVTATIDSGQPFNLGIIQGDIRDMIDGFSATIMALDPDQGLRFKAATTAAGNSIYQSAAKRAGKNFIAQQTAVFDEAIINVAPVLQSVFENLDSIDPSTGKPVEIEPMLEVLRRPFADSVEIFGDAKYLTEYNKMVREAKINTLVGQLTDREQFATSADALDAIAKRDFGAATQLYEGMSQDERQKVSDNVLKSFSNQHQADQQTRTARDNAAKDAWRSSSLRLLNENTPVSEKRKIVSDAVLSGAITVDQASAFLKPDSPKGDDTLFNTLRDQITRGAITSPEELTQYKGRLSSTQYTTLGSAVTSVQYKDALVTIRQFAGIPENVFYDPPAEQKRRQREVLELYKNQLLVQVDNGQGVMVFQEPAQAAQKAIEIYDKNVKMQNFEDELKVINDNLATAYSEAGLPKTTISLPNIDLTKINNSTLRNRVKKLQEDYRQLMQQEEGE
jgi:hypothetical protein